MKNSKPLWEYTRDLHHACEAHKVGGAMATGKPPKIWYYAWARALHQIHYKLDQHCDPLLRRSRECMDDYCAGGFIINPFDSATAYVNQLNDPKMIDGAIYVLTGAHLMGGEIMRRRLEGFPTAHLQWEDRKGALAILTEYRTRDDIGDEARKCFEALLAIMDEIAERYPDGE